MVLNRPVSLTLVGLFVWVTGCNSYKQIEPAEVSDYGEVRVTFSDGERSVLKDVTVEGDSIHYWQGIEQSAQYSAVRTSSPLDQVVELEAVGATSGGIGLAVVFVAVVGGVLICAAACDFDFNMFGE